MTEANEFSGVARNNTTKVDILKIDLANTLYGRFNHFVRNKINTALGFSGLPMNDSIRKVIDTAKEDFENQVQAMLTELQNGVRSDPFNMKEDIQKFLTKCHEVDWLDMSELKDLADEAEILLKKFRLIINLDE